MELTGEQLLPVTRERVWAALLDSETLRAAIPGCEAVTLEGDGRYAVRVVATVGPVKARFKGRLQQQDLQPPQRYTLSFEGDGGIAGFAKGSAEVELTEVEGASTLLAYRAQAQIGGRLAQIGSRLVDATAARMSAQFFERLTAAISGELTVAAQARPVSVIGFGQPPTESPDPVRVPQAVVASGIASAPVTLTMPAWAWSFTIATVALLAAWITTH